MKVLVTGGAGYVGSHTVIELIRRGYEVVVLDSFVNAGSAVMERMAAIAGKEIPFVKACLNDRAALKGIFENEGIDCVIHFAGLKAVGESVEKPMLYYRSNIGGTMTLLEEMAAYNVKRIIFSSSATVYGNDNPSPFTEEMPTSATNPYGYTKVVIERMLQDLYGADPEWNVISLRYFNPLGAHESGRIGENPNGVPNNIMPYITQVAVGRLKELTVFGDDYETPDGTGVRDYIHVSDLARGHILALEKLKENPGCEIYNLGTGVGVSVLDLVKTFETVSGVKIPYKIGPRRKGDIAACYASVAKAEKELGFTAEKSLEDMLRDSWQWQKNNPNGYA